MTNDTTPLVTAAIFCAFPTSQYLLTLSCTKLNHTLNYYVCTPQSINIIDIDPCRKIYYINSVAITNSKDKKMKTHMSFIANTLKPSRPGLFSRNIRWATYVILNILVITLKEGKETLNLILIMFILIYLKYHFNLESI